jgi:hypothetical protein
MQLWDPSLPAVQGLQNLKADSTNAYQLDMSGSSCTQDVNCLLDQVVAGDTLQLTASNCSCGGGGCPVVTTVGETTLTINMTVADAFPLCTGASGFQYSGYFVTPAHDATPSIASAGLSGWRGNHERELHDLAV